MATIMTMEERAAAMDRLYNEAVSLADKFNAALRDGKNDEALLAESSMKETMKQYNALSMKQQFETFRMAEEGPLMAAIKALTYPTLRKRDVSEEGAILKTRVVEQDDSAVDLFALHKYLNKKSGVDNAWPWMVQAFWRDMTEHVGDGINVDKQFIHDNIKISKEAKAVNLGKNPCSQTQIIKTMNAISAAMVGEGYKFRKEDVAYLREAFTSEDNRILGAIKVKKLKGFSRMILVAMHHAVTGTPYSLIFPHEEKDAE